MNDMIIELITIVIAIIAFLVGRYILPKVKANIKEAAAEFEVLLKYAESYVAYARQFLDFPGNEKMNMVVEKLKVFCAERGIVIDEETLKAIAQRAYDAMIAGENAAKIIIESPITDVHNMLLENTTEVTDATQVYINKELDPFYDETK